MMIETMSRDPLSVAAPATAAGFWRDYASGWRRTPGNAVFLIAGFVTAMTALGLLAALFWAGVGMLVLVIGIPVVVLSLLVARGFSVAERGMLRLTGLPPIPEPEWNLDRSDRTGWWSTLTRPLRNAHYWVALGHGMLVNPVVGTVSFALAVSWIGVGLGGLTYWFWGAFLPREGETEWGRYVADALPWLFGGWPAHTVQVVLYLVAGVLFTITMPFVLGGLAAARHAIARGMLGRWRSDDLAVEARAEAAARAAAVHAEDVSLRRLERDIHDGPQQRLVRLQLDLAAVTRRVEAGETDAAAALAREAQEHAKVALNELRALSSGVAPPLLQDRGLVAALEGLAAAGVVPVRAHLDPAIDAVVGPETARAAYFVVAELLANVGKHAGATTVTLDAAVLPGAPATLALTVTDDGRGGATPRPGHGLAGLQERLHGLRGSLTLDSPVGGPTTVRVSLPVAVAG